MLAQILLAGSDAQSLLLSEFWMLFLKVVRLVLSCVLPSCMISRLLFMFSRATLVCLMAAGTQAESEWATRVLKEKKLEMSSDTIRGLGHLDSKSLVLGCALTGGRYTKALRRC